MKLINYINDLENIENHDDKNNDNEGEINNSKDELYSLIN